MPIELFSQLDCGLLAKLRIERAGVGCSRHEIAQQPNDGQDSDGNQDCDG